MPNPKVGIPLPPTVLAQVPRTVVRKLNLSTVLLDALTSSKHHAKYGPVLALLSLESYFEAAKLQQRRIRRANSTLWAPGTATLRRPFDEIHFYLICWTRIARLAKFIASATKFRRIGRVLRRYHTEIKERWDARDHLEHFEDRLPGGAKQSKLRLRSDLLNMANDFLTYGGSKVDVGPASLRLLKTIVDEFRTALLFDSVEALGNSNPTCLGTLLQKAARDFQLGRVTRQVLKKFAVKEGAG